VELFTGDQGAVDEEGYIYFAARADDLIKHRGNRISPVEIETAACAVPGVVEAALIKRPSGDSLHLFVTVSDSGPQALIIRQQLAETLEPFKVPEIVTIEVRLPKSLNGKIDRKALLRIAETGIPSKEIHEPLLEAIGG
jgi:acyl-coenzyme A synthetase/AMP-(fatty) acid ligase